MKHRHTALIAIGFLLLVFGLNCLQGCTSQSKVGCRSTWGMAGYGGVPSKTIPSQR